MTAKKKLSDNSDLNIINEINRVPMTQSSRERMSLNIYDLQYLIRLQDLSNEAFKQTFDEEFRIEVAKSVAKELAEVIAPINEKLSSIAGDIKIMKEDITNIRERLGEVEDEVICEKKEISELKIRMEHKKKKIAELERKVALLQPDSIEYLSKFSEKMLHLEPLLEKTIKSNSIINHIFRISIGVLIGIIAVYFLIKHWWVNLF